jgi:hypothetical protein
MQPMATPVPPRRGGARLALVLVGVLAAGLVGFGIVVATRGQAGTASPADAALVTASTDAASAPADAAQAAIVADAGTAVTAVTDAAVANDAAGSDSPQKDARAAHPSEKRMGRLVVRAFPILTVYVDNRKIHDTPVDMKLQVGKHRLRLVNAEVGKNETLTVTIEENKTATIERN